MKNSNADLARFCIGRLGVPYVMGTNGKIFTSTMYSDLTERNPADWFTEERRPAVESLIGERTTDCHGLIEWFAAELAGGKWNYDTTADEAFEAAQEKDGIGSLPEQPGVCVRFSGHVGVYIGGGYVVEARGFEYGVCLTKLAERPWTHWYQHPKIRYAVKALPAPNPMKVGKTTGRYSIVWLQLALNQQIAAEFIKEPALEVDGVYGKRTAEAAAAYWQRKGWAKRDEVWGVGKNTVRALQRL